MDKRLRSILTAIAILGRTGPPTVVAVAKKTGHERDALIAPLADLEAACHVITWIDRSGSTRVALLRDPRERAEAKAARLRRRADAPEAEGRPVVELLPDPRAGDPAEIAEARERIERLAVGDKSKEAKSDRGPRRPTMILAGVQSWPPLELFGKAV